MGYGNSTAEQRRSYSQERLVKFRDALLKSQFNENDRISKILGEEVCVCATGSYGRVEASENSDLDLVIVHRREKSSQGQAVLSNLDAILIKAALIETARNEKFSEYDGDGKFLKVYTTQKLTDLLGTEKDDFENTFTTRLLLLLESCPVTGEKAYKDIVDDLIKAYWRDYDKHQSDFVPAFFLNDTLRLWRTFCVNYEAKARKYVQSEESGEDGVQNKDPLAGLKVKNFKLKYSRIMTCYASVIYLLTVFKDQGTVTPVHMREMVEKSPTDRLRYSPNSAGGTSLRKLKNKILRQYDWFLEVTGRSEGDLINFICDESNRTSIQTQSSEFHESMTSLLLRLSKENKLFRYIMI